MSTAPIKSGDCVRLKTGGVHMIVSGINSPGPGSEPVAMCYYRDSSDKPRYVRHYVSDLVRDNFIEFD